jgi:tetratricopeptide (TPR) repeat protein
VGVADSEGLLKQALEAARAVKAVIPEDPRAYFSEGNTLLLLGDIEAARACYSRILEREANHREARLCHSFASFAIAQSKAALGESYDELLSTGVEDLRVIIAVEPENPRALGSLGWILAWHGFQESLVRPIAPKRFLDAIVHLRKAVELDPQSVTDWANLCEATLWWGLSLKAQGEDPRAAYEESLVANVRALELMPDDSGLWRRKGALLLAQVLDLDAPADPVLGQALAALQQAGDDPEACILRSRVHRERASLSGAAILDELNAAVDQGRRALKWASEYPASLEAVGDSLARRSLYLLGKGQDARSDAEEAVPLLEKLASRFPGNLQSRMEVGRALLARALATETMRDAEVALEHLSYVIQNNSQEGETLWLRAQAYRMLGRIAEAINDLKQLHDLGHRHQEVEALLKQMEAREY